MKAYGVKKPVYFVFSYDEEVGCLGAPDIAKYIEAQGLTPELAIIGEPTLMQVVNAHKGIVTFNTTVTGLEAHSSKTHLGVNAVMVAAQLIEYLRLLGDNYRAMPNDSRFDPPYSTVHVGTVAGGTARNIIPRECSFQWEIRPLKDEDAADIIQKFEAYCATLLPAMQAVHPAAGIGTERMSHNPALEPDDDMTSEHLLMQLIGTNRVDAVSFYTEAGIFHHHGIPAIVCGPGSIDQAHRPNEFIETGQIDACIALLQKLMHKLL
jgi:acetylornithine deacetylase